ncbi:MULTISPECIES: glycosyltransferase family 2 protein [Hyphomonas]|uniref:Glycosyl transferase family 2 n=1 Tax=Hyphomonas adhaerens TaxID=81029 RepID=A0A3B9GV86_9PROT|nr:MULTISPECIES: glycosyltransferase family 2 protein [Hyphomonas]MBB39846.1 glycosyl transferase family 2 [Hyphomonas sp.]HAE26343.1 glycosyl transferase family 2 [Hyphomonas adhaerens]|tara:strand:+ start:8274 stop:9314 length:1041 start_codon:yes stop_codon:yes gene_type:complete
MPSIAVVIPSYKVKSHIIATINGIGPEVSRIYVVDDKCPEGTGHHVEHNCKDSRVIVLYHESNKGVGGSTITGYRQAVADGSEILIKLDGDGQMDARLIPFFVEPIQRGLADYVKGNRFFSGKALKSMPNIRLFGNAVLSFMTKASSGYWDMLDPTNGYTAIHAKVLSAVDLDQVSSRYFFESDMLFQLGKIRARVIDLPLMSLYGAEESNLRISKVLPEFLGNNIKNLLKRIVYVYFVRGFSLASIALIMSSVLLLVGSISALVVGVSANLSGVPASTGAIVSVAILLIFGFQLLMTFLSHDISSTPNTAIHPLLAIVPGAPLDQSYPGGDSEPSESESGELLDK